MCSKISNFVNDRKEKHVVLGYEEGWRKSFDIPQWNIKDYNKNALTYSHYHSNTSERSRWHSIIKS